MGTRTIIMAVVGSFILGTLAAMSPSFAHKVEIAVYTEKGTMFVETYFADGGAVKGGKVEVLSKEGAKLLEGVTDEGGKFSFPLPQQAEGITVVVDAGMGHRATYVVRKEDLAP